MKVGKQVEKVKEGVKAEAKEPVSLFKRAAPIARPHHSRSILTPFHPSCFSTSTQGS